MNALKNIFFTALVAAISFGIFTLMEDKKTAENILASVAEIVIDELIARVPEEEQSKLSAKRDELINKIDENKLSEEQYKTFMARMTNLNLYPDSVSAEEINAILEKSVQSVSAQQNGQSFAITKAKAEQWERRIRHIREFEAEISKIKNDSVRERLVRHVMVTPESDFQLVFNDDIRHDPQLSRDPEAQRFIEKLPDMKWVKFENFSKSIDIPRQAIKFHAPGLPPHVRMPIILRITAGETISISIDSITADMPKNFIDASEWEQFNRAIQDAREQWDQEAK